MNYKQKNNSATGTSLTYRNPLPNNEEQCINFLSSNNGTFKPRNLPMEFDEEDPLLSP